MEKKQCECKFGFAGVFIFGVLGIWMTANYYLKKEAEEDRIARSRRVATEMARIQTTSTQALTSLTK